MYHNSFDVTVDSHDTHQNDIRSTSSVWDDENQIKQLNKDTGMVAYKEATVGTIGFDVMLRCPQDNFPLKKRRIRNNKGYFPCESSYSINVDDQSQLQNLEIISKDFPLDKQDTVLAQSLSSVKVQETSLRRLVASCWKYYPHSTALLPKDYYKEVSSSQKTKGTVLEPVNDCYINIDENSIRTTFIPDWLKITKLPPTSGPYYYDDDKAIGNTDHDSRMKHYSMFNKLYSNCGIAVGYLGDTNTL